MMKTIYTVYFTDGSSGMVKAEKPPGAHPDSYIALREGIIAAERTGKIVDRIGRSYVLSGAIIDKDFPSRDVVLQHTKPISAQAVIAKCKT